MRNLNLVLSHILKVLNIASVSLTLWLSGATHVDWLFIQICMLLVLAANLFILFMHDMVVVRIKKLEWVEDSYSRLIDEYEKLGEEMIRTRKELDYHRRTGNGTHD